MAVRKIVQIDGELCDGCGQCVPSCAEGAIQVIGGKAKLVKDQYCDGLGACLGECPQGAISVIERDADEYDQGAVDQHLERLGKGGQPHGPAVHAAAAARPAVPPAPSAMRHAHASHAGGGCPGAAMRQFAARPAAARPAGDAPAAASALRQWPVQLHLLSPLAPYFRDADLLLAADCGAFACGDFHARFMEGRAIAIACPKLDDPSGYVEKLAAMITHSGIRSITIVMMQVPCCRGLEHLARQAMESAGQEVPVRRVILSLEGDVLSEA